MHPLPPRYGPGAEKRVDLNVGGVHFLSTMETLLGRPDSATPQQPSFRRRDSNAQGNFFSQIVAGYWRETSRSGRVAPHECEKPIDVFIDRNPTHFNYILDYLRKGSVNPPPEEHFLRDIADEARFYGLMDLVDTIQANIGDRERTVRLDEAMKSDARKSSETRLEQIASAVAAVVESKCSSTHGADTPPPPVQRFSSPSTSVSPSMRHNGFPPCSPVISPRHNSLHTSLTPRSSHDRVRPLPPLPPSFFGPPPRSGQTGSRAASPAAPRFPLAQAPPPVAPQILSSSFSSQLQPLANVEQQRKAEIDVSVGSSEVDRLDDDLASRKLWAASSAGDADVAEGGPPLLSSTWAARNVNDPTKSGDDGLAPAQSPIPAFPSTFGGPAANPSEAPLARYGRREASPSSAPHHPPLFPATSNMEPRASSQQHSSNLPRRHVAPSMSAMSTPISTGSILDSHRGFQRRSDVDRRNLINDDNSPPKIVDSSFADAVLGEKKIGDDVDF